MPPSKQGKKRRPLRSSSSSPGNNDPNQPTETRQATINNPNQQSQANTPNSMTSPRATSEIIPAEIRLDTGIHHKYIKRQEKTTHPGAVEIHHQQGLTDEDRYIAIEDTIRTVIKFVQRVQYNQSSPPIALSSIFPGLNLIVKDQEVKDPEYNNIQEDSVTTTGRNSYHSETSHSAYSPSDASSNTTSAHSLARTPRAISKLATPAEIRSPPNAQSIQDNKQLIQDARQPPSILLHSKEKQQSQQVIIVSNTDLSHVKTKR